MFGYKNFIRSTRFTWPENEQHVLVTKKTINKTWQPYLLYYIFPYSSITTAELFILLNISVAQLLLPN